MDSTLFCCNDSTESVPEAELRSSARIEVISGVRPRADISKFCHRSLDASFISLRDIRLHDCNETI